MWNLLTLPPPTKIRIFIIRCLWGGLTRLFFYKLFPRNSWSHLWKDKFLVGQALVVYWYSGYLGSENVLRTTLVGERKAAVFDRGVNWTTAQSKMPSSKKPWSFIKPFKVIPDKGNMFDLCNFYHQSETDIHCLNKGSITMGVVVFLAEVTCL